MEGKEEMLGGQPSIQNVNNSSNIEQNPKKVNDSESNLLDMALKYRNKGWAIIPVNETRNGNCTCGRVNCQNPGKHPRGKWKEYQDRLPTEEEIIKWWTDWPTANIGLVTGKISGLIALDIDKRSGGEATIKDRDLIIPRTLISKTGGGGWHCIFKHPQFDCRNFAGHKGGAVLPGIDFRGDGGFIVLPPSIHPSGNTYRWANEPAVITEAPEWLLKLIQAQDSETDNLPAIVEVISPIEGFQEGSRDNNLFRYACRLRDKGLSKDEAIVLILTAAENCNPPFPRQEALKKIESAFNGAVSERKSIGEKPETFTAEELDEMVLPPTKWILEGILPEGLTLLAGRAKSGKSFLALQIAISTALGKDICGFKKIIEEMPIEEIPPGYTGYDNGPRGVLYMDLEMDKQSIRERMRAGVSVTSSLTVTKTEDGLLRFSGTLANAPSNLHFAMDWPPIGSGFVEYLTEFLDNNTDVELVVVDIFNRIRPVITGKDRRNSYELDYAALIPLQDLAKTRGIAILVLHHTRKKIGHSTDAVEAVSGTMGLTGAADSIYTLEKNSNNTAILHISGRKFEGQRIIMKQGPGGIWEIVTEADRVQISAERVEVMKLLEDSKRPMKIQEIAKALGVNYNARKKLLWQMAKDGFVKKEKDGGYIPLKKSDSESSEDY